ncbi:MAG: hypothetical protein ABIZ81_01795 [Opitutaceae bacterium]
MITPSRTPLASALACSRFLAAGVAAIASGSTAFAERLVTVRATADTAYAEQRNATAPPKPEKYIFAKGQYFAGVTYDSTLEKMPFRQIVETLAVDLQRQNYHPTPSLGNADIVITVHWGVTMGNDRGGSGMSLAIDALRESAEELDLIRQEFAETQTIDLDRAAAAEASFRNSGVDLSMQASGNDIRSSSNAGLLGMKTALDQEGGNLLDTETARTLRAMIDEERYFIIMVAYDAAKFRRGKAVRLWTSRLSIRSAGVNFKMALDRMSNAGAKTAGTKQKELLFEFVQDRVGNVKVGELKVLE